MALASTVILAACQEAVVTFDGSDTRPKRTSVITPDGTDRFDLSSPGSTALVTAPGTNRDQNLRMVFWPTGARAEPDGQSCATWTGQHGAPGQQGAALRLKLDPSGRMRGVTVTKNILWGAVWNFNVHTVDTLRAEPMQKVGDMSFERELRPGGKIRPFPWHVCVRALGATVELKVWTGTEPEPAWGDQTHSGRVQLPAGWAFPGTFGWYIGHIPPGGDARFTDLRTWRYTPDGASPTTRPGRTATVARSAP
ncbi:MAG: hypothetical protein JWM05_2051 [Acidimicrobiales bacterium]|nr:hypothetical protein [Acidimicrobiales bacterium]